MASQQSEQTTKNQPTYQKRFIAALAIAIFSTGLANSILVLFATNIAKTFYGTPTPIAVASITQLSTINIAAEVVGALVLSILVLRFKHKKLLLAGTVFIIVSAVGSYLSPTLLALQIFIALEGAGSIMIGIISMSLIADALPQKQRARIISYLFSVGSAVSLVLIPIVGLITEMGGWRAGMLFLMMPISLLGLILIVFTVPSKPVQTDQNNKTNPYIDGFKQILKNKSATAVLIANLLTIAGTEVAIFAIAFYKTTFGATTAQTVLIYEVALILFIIAPLLSGRLITRYGAKLIALITTFLAAIFTGAFFVVPNFWASFTLDMMHVWFAAMAAPAFALVVLQQLPKYRATVFSLNGFFNNIGKVLAPLIGGILLAVSAGGYSQVGFALGGTTIAGCIILLFAVKETTE
jgi:predicted MFS family arabinose efflux permease